MLPIPSVDLHGLLDFAHVVTLSSVMDISFDPTFAPSPGALWRQRTCRPYIEVHSPHLFPADGASVTSIGRIDLM